jgi:hypothetical protein
MLLPALPVVAVPVAGVGVVVVVMGVVRFSG